MDSAGTPISFDVETLWQGGPTFKSRTKSSVIASFGLVAGATVGVEMLGMLGTLLGAAVAGPAVLGVALVFGGKEVLSERRRQLTDRRQQARAFLAGFVEEVRFETDGRLASLIGEIQRQMRARFTDRIRELHRTYTESAEALSTQRAGESIVAGAWPRSGRSRRSTTSPPREGERACRSGFRIPVVRRKRRWRIRRGVSRISPSTDPDPNRSMGRIGPTGPYVRGARFRSQGARRVGIGGVRSDGRRTRKWAPPPWRFETSIEPSWRSTIHLAIASPSPVPPDGAPLARQNRSKRCGMSSGLHASAVVLDVERARCLPHAGRRPGRGRPPGCGGSRCRRG